MVADLDNRKVKLKIMNCQGLQPLANGQSIVFQSKKRAKNIKNSFACFSV